MTMADNNEENGRSSNFGCGVWNCHSRHGKWIGMFLIAVLATAPSAKSTESKDVSPSTPAASVTNAPVPETATPEMALPRLVDLGAGKCIPCKMMAPILEDLKKTCAGKLNVQFIDVWQNPDAGKKYGINLIPTQIFYDAAGKELFRHEGFFGKKDILAKWKEFGVELPMAKEDAPK
jgi:thioredoxin 1